MTHRLFRCVCTFTVPAFVLFVLAGCGSRGSDLPAEVTVELPDGTSVKVEQGAGVPSLKNSSWEFFRTAESAQGAGFVTVVFDENGAMTRFENSTIASEIFGSTLVFDGVRHNTTQSGLQYAAATYGAETSDATGFSFEGRVTAFAAGIEAASATATATATFDDDDPNTVRGRFHFTSQVTLLSIPEGNQDDEFPFVGYRLIGE